MAPRVPESRRRRLLFVLGGASHNWHGPGRELYRAEPVFRAVVDGADAAVRERLGFSTTGMFLGTWAPGSPDEQRRSDILNMGLLHIGLIDLWSARGVRPDGVLGLSLGEAGSAYASGAIDRATAVRIYCAFAAHVDARPDDHILYVVEAGAEAALRLCAAAPAPLHLAGEAVPGSCALLTPARHGEEVEAYLRSRIAILEIHPTKWPYHVPTGAFDEAGAAAELADISWRSPDLPVYLASLGRRMGAGDRLDGAQWAAMCAGPYLLAGASRAAFGDGFDLLVNIGTASIGDWVLAAAPAGADLARFDATPGGGDSKAWRRPLKSVRALVSPAPRRSPPDVDLASPENLADPYAAYERLRPAGPVQFLARHNAWIALSHEAVQALFTDTEGLSNRAYDRVGPVLMAQDPPGHKHVRRLAGTLFSPGATAGRVETVRATARALVARDFDLVSGYARPIAQAVARTLLDIPESVAPTFVRAARAYHGDGRDIGAYVDRLDAIAAETGAAEGLAARGDGLLTATQARQLVRFLWMAATETTERVIVRCGLVLLSDRALRERVAGDRSLLPAFVDEVIRLHPPELIVPRTTVAPVRPGGIPIPAGQHVLLCLAAANRDPDIFAAPAEIRLDRGIGRHLSFGTGIHKCSGTAIAGPIVVAALETLLEQAPDLRPAEPLDALAYHSTITVHSPRRLLVAR
jgi:cytochrome P450